MSKQCVNASQKLLLPSTRRGCCTPKVRVSLTDGQTVRLQVLTEESSKDTKKIIQSLVAAGLVTPPQHDSDVEPVREEAWRELTQRLEA